MDNLKSKLHTIDETKTTTSVSTPLLLMIIVAAVVLGVGSGFLFNKVSAGSSTKITSKDSKETKDGESKDSAGVLDKKTFTDQAEGTLKEGGFEGEGNFHLVRPGGDDQNVYLTSTAVDLSEFIDKKVSVWGQTYEAEKAGWLMDVGYIEISK